MSHKPVTAVYVFDRPHVVFEDRDAKYLNQVNYSFGLVVDGKVSGDHWEHIEDYKAFIRKYPHIFPVLSVGGWGAGGFSEAASTAEGRALFADSTIELLEKHGFLGVDIDWEYPCSSEAGIASSPDDRENFTLLLKELRTRLDALTLKDGKKRLLATALGASPSMLDNIDCPVVAQIVDQVNLMTYDIQTNTVASHHTALGIGDERYPNSADYAVRLFVDAGVPKEKIMIGAAFYGKAFTLKEASDNPCFTDAEFIVGSYTDYRHLHDQLKTMKLCFDDKAKAPYALDGTKFITYDDPVSIRHKGAYVTQNGLMGMMCWEYGSDYEGELLQAMYEGMNQ